MVKKTPNFKKANKARINAMPIYRATKSDFEDGLIVELEEFLSKNGSRSLDVGQSKEEWLTTLKHLRETIEEQIREIGE